MSQNIEIHAELREDVGKGASRRLRRSAEHVPAIIYGGETAPEKLTLSTHELTKAMQAEAFFSQILDVIVKGKTQQAVLRDLQRNPANDRVLHIDFMRISANKPIQVSVPFHFVDEDQCIGVREGGGVINHPMTEVEISCLPADLPEYLEVFMAQLELNQAVHLTDVAVPPGVTIVALSHSDDYDSVVASVAVPRVIEEEVEEVVDEELEADAEAGEGEGAEDEGDAPAEGSAKDAASDD